MERADGSVPGFRGRAFSRRTQQASKSEMRARSGGVAEGFLPLHTCGSPSLASGPAGDAPGRRAASGFVLRWDCDGSMNSGLSGEKGNILLQGRSI
jgi:hypothetical protein